MILKTYIYIYIYIYILKKIYLTRGSTSDPLVELVARLINRVNVRSGFNNYGCMPLFQKHGSSSWLVFQNLCSFVLDMQSADTTCSKSVVKKSLLSPTSMVVTNIQPPLFGMLDRPKIMSFPFLFFL